MANKKPPDPRGGHVRIYWSMLDSVAWRTLGTSSQALYVVLRRKLHATNNGNISAALGDLKHYGIKSSATLAKSLRELQALGFIAITRQGGIAYGRQVCSLYRFTDEPVLQHPKIKVEACQTSNDWRRFITLADAESELHQAHSASKTKARKNTSGLQKLKRTDSDCEALKSFNDSDSEATTAFLVQKMKQAKKVEHPVNPHAA